MAFDLPRLPQHEPTWPQWQIWWQQVVEAIEAQEARQDQVLTDLATALASLSEVAPLTFYADYQGTIDPAEQLPLEIAIKRFEGSTDVTAETDFTISDTVGAITASVGLNTGILEITAVGSSGSLTISSDRDGIIKTRLIPITKSVAAAPSGGGGGGGNPSATDTSFASINSASHAPISDELTVTVGGSGNVDLSATLTVYTARSGLTNTYAVFGKWQWWDGAAWADVAAEVQTSPDVEIENEGGFITLVNGSLDVVTQKTGLTPAASEKFRLTARNGSGTRTMSFSGSASAVP